MCPSADKPEDFFDPTMEDESEGLKATGAEMATGRKEAAKTAADEVLPKLALLASLTRHQARALRANAPRISALLIHVPSNEWIEPMAKAARAISRWDMVLASREVRPAKKEESASAIVKALSQGHRVLGVSDNPARDLPSCLLAAADHTVTIARPSDQVIKAVVTMVTGRRPRGAPESLAQGLNFNDIVACIRPDSTPAECMRRLASATASKTVVDATLEGVPTLDRLHGYGAAMDWCTTLIADLDAWKRGSAPFPTNCRAVFAGPPGTGKTTLVRSLARTSKLPLVATSVGSWFADSPGHLDSVIKEIAKVWETARALGTAVVLVDELDALPNRATMDARGRDWWTPVITYVLTCLDSATSGVTRNLIIVGTTNHAAQLDTALIRPGRLETVIHVGFPEKAVEREAIIRTHLDGQLEGVDLSSAALATAGMSGADLAALVRNARRRAGVAGREVSVPDLMECLFSDSSWSEADRLRCAIHEAGHAVAACATGFLIDTVRVVERLGSAGEVSYVQASLPKLPTRADLESWAMVALSGAAAEDVVLGSRSVGHGGTAESDIGQVTRVIAGLHASYGLGETLSFRAHPDEVGILLGQDSEFRRQVDMEISRLYSEALDLLRTHRRAVEWLARSLTTARVMSGEQVRAGLHRFGMPPRHGHMATPQVDRGAEGSFGPPAFPLQLPPREGLLGVAASGNAGCNRNPKAVHPSFSRPRLHLAGPYVRPKRRSPFRKDTERRGRG
ncbi:AAA family ATPase [Lichenihabitans sp. Uapishka_5]|uniref:AAA family ATPase n=1 Tax=Lichenihabitans sp. Uapishka_5 TaxID=3037302 RepID=UPI0029E8055D|nr:AAA family ATPase [Lichenihabitans sp. Uapishka_5]MDX7952860.1 AAA family ATPase [Lichenihabitans sp. Uapishka_5]